MKKNIVYTKETKKTLEAYESKKSGRMIWMVMNFSPSSPTRVQIYLHQVVPKQHLAKA